MIQAKQIAIVQALIKHCNTAIQHDTRKADCNSASANPTCEALQGSNTKWYRTASTLQFCQCPSKISIVTPLWDHLQCSSTAAMGVAADGIIEATAHLIVPCKVQVTAAPPPRLCVRAKLQPIMLSAPVTIMSITLIRLSDVNIIVIAVLILVLIAVILIVRS